MALNKSQKKKIKEQKRNTKKKRATATLLALVVLLTGTFAWNAFDQNAVNKTILQYEITKGGRLHDDYNGVNKDVYVENFTTYEQGGQDIITRVRLDEYMEIGTNAGSGSAVDVEVLRGDIQHSTPDITDPTTWDTYDFGSVIGVSNTIRSYRDLEFGGRTIYMPTFNKNAEDESVEHNGTLAGIDGNIETDFEESAYSDYVVYTNGQEITADATYYDYDELDTVEEETHTAKPTIDGTVISMQDWLDNGAILGDYWVYDTNGWAYWASPVVPETATGLLLDEVDIVRDPLDDWYYAINVVSEIATQDDIGSKEDGTGFYEDATDNAMDLLDRLSGAIENVEMEVTNVTGRIDVEANEEVILEVEVFIPAEEDDENIDTDEDKTEILSELVDDEAEVERVKDGFIWSMYEIGNSGLSQDEINATVSTEENQLTFVPTSDMVGNQYAIVIRSEIDATLTETTIINVFDADNLDDEIYMSLTVENNPIPMPVSENAADTNKNAGIGIHEYTRDSEFHSCLAWDTSSGEEPSNTVKISSNSSCSGRSAGADIKAKFTTEKC